MVKVCVLHCNPNMVGMIHKILLQFDMVVTIITGYKYELKYYIRHKDIDIIIVQADYIANGHDGIFVSKRIKIMQRKALIIYLSQSDDSKEYLNRIINSEPFALVHNNRLVEDLPPIIAKAIHIICKDNCNFTYRKNNEDYTVSLKNVIYFMSCHRTVQYLCLNGDKDEFYNKMDKLEKVILNLTDRFVRVHQSYFINMDLVLSYDNNSVKMVNEEIIMISRKYRINLERIKEYKM